LTILLEKIESLLQKQHNILIPGMIFFSYLTDFSYFSVKKKFQKLQDTVRTGQK